MRDPAFESCVHRFEQAWRQGTSGAIADFLDGALPRRRDLLIELICIDLEYRWRACRVLEPIPLAAYVAEFPEVGEFDQMPLELIGEEYRARCQWGDRPSHGAFLAQFPGRQEEIRPELIRVDEELAVESGPTPVLSSLPAPADAAILVDVALRSDRDFLLRRLIGAGRMGKVFEAVCHDGGRPVAVKFLRKSFLSHPAVVRRFITEARTIARLRHPQIVGTEGLGRTAGGSYFIVMDLVAGPDLAQVLGQRPIAVAEAVRWVVAACHALEHAHEQGVVHCDLKPANLLLDGSGSIRVTDFGLARSLTEETPGASEVEGSAPFMAPEQASRTWGAIDTRTDVYGLGALLYTLLTGRPPFVGKRLPDVLAQVISATPVIAPMDFCPEIPRPLSDLCRRCLAKPMADRFPSVRDLRLALALIAGLA